MNKISDLIQSALEDNDYKFRINFLIGGLICEEANDTEEKELKNMEYLKEIYEFCKSYSGDKKEYVDHIANTIQQYVLQ